MQNMDTVHSWRIKRNYSCKCNYSCNQVYYSVILLIRRNVYILFFGVSKKYRLQHLFHIQKGSDLISFSKTVLKIKRAILPILRFGVGQSWPRMTETNFGVAM